MPDDVPTTEAIRQAQAAARQRTIAMRNARAAEALRLIGLMAAEIRAWLGTAAGPDGRIPSAQLGAIHAYLAGQFGRFSRQLREWLDAGVRDAVAIGAELLALTGRTGGDAAFISQVVESLRNFIAADGLQLSDRIWRTERLTREAVRAAIEGAIARGESASAAAARYLRDGLPVPAAVQGALAAAQSGAIGIAVERVLVSGAPGTTSANVNRLLRTEINRAYTESFVAGLAENPDVVGVKFLLSRNHPAVDVCLRAGALIETDSGYVPVEKILIGMRVRTHRNRFRCVTRLYQRPYPAGPMIRLHCPGESSHIPALVLTPNHPVLTPTGWTAAGDLCTESLVAFAPSSLVESRCRVGGCAPRTGASGSAQSAPASLAGSIGAEQCGEYPLRTIRKPRNAVRGLSSPKFARNSGAGTSGSFGFLRSIWGFLRPSFLRTFATDKPLTTEIGLDDACRSSDCFHPTAASIPQNSVSCACYSPLKRMADRTSGTKSALLHAACNSSFPSRTCVSHSSIDGRAREIWRRIQDRWSRLLVDISYVDSNMITYRNATAQRIATQGEVVFNLEVDSDHSYVANGIVVHNCDFHAAVNLHGLGPGVYPLGAHPYPAHPNTLSYLQMVLTHEVSDADRAGKQTGFDWLAQQPSDVQDAVLAGKKKGAAFRAGQLEPGELHAPWRTIAARLGVAEEGA